VKAGRVRRGARCATQTGRSGTVCSGISGDWHSLCLHLLILPRGSVTCRRDAGAFFCAHFPRMAFAQPVPRQCQTHACTFDMLSVSACLFAGSPAALLCTLTPAPLTAVCTHTAHTAPFLHSPTCLPTLLPHCLPFLPCTSLPHVLTPVPACTSASRIVGSLSARIFELGRSRLLHTTRCRVLQFTPPLWRAYDHTGTRSAGRAGYASPQRFPHLSCWLIFC